MAYGLLKEDFYLFSSIMLLFLVVLIVLFQPFKPQYQVYNTIHTLLFLNLAMWFMTVVLTYRSRSIAFAVFASAVVIILPLFYITGLVLKWMHSRKFYYEHFVSKMYCLFQRNANNVVETDCINSIPYQNVLNADPANCGNNKYGIFD